MSEQSIVDAMCPDVACARRDTYLIEVRCINCGWNGRQRVTCGHEPSVGRSIGAACPRCEVRWLAKGDFIVREGRAALASQEARDE